MGDSRDIPRVAGRGARKEGESDINEVGDNQIDELLRKPGDWGRAQGRRLRGILKEKLVDFGYAPPQDLAASNSIPMVGVTRHDE